MSQFAPKQVIGDYGLDSDPQSSFWQVLGNQTGGLGAEEFKDPKRFWYSNAITEVVNQLTPPRLATSVALPAYTISLRDGAFDDWADAYNMTHWAFAQVTGVPELSRIDVGAPDYSARITATAASDVATLSQSLTTWTSSYQGRSITVRYTLAIQGGGFPSTSVIQLYDGVSTQTGTSHTIAGTYTDTFTIGGGANQAIIRWRYTANAGAGADYHQMTVLSIEDFPMFGSGALQFCNHAGDLYVGKGNWLGKLNTTGDGWTEQKVFFVASETSPKVITHLVSSIGSQLYVFLGGSTNYWYGAATSYTETNVALGDIGIEWDGKLFKIDVTTKIIYYTATPNSATPTWTANGTITDLEAEGVKSLALWRDVNGNDLIYAGTVNGVWAHDFTNAQWLRTDLQVPNHPQGGRGFRVFRDALYYSAGLDVVSYKPAYPTEIASVGLNRDEGLPSEYAGGITHMMSDFNNLFALVDSTLDSATNTSSIQAYNEHGWRTFWQAPSTEGTLTSCILSSEYAYRLWFEHAGTVYYIPISTSLSNPFKLSAQTYAASAIHISSIFDANWQVGNKLALALYVKSHKDMSANNTVQVKYRLNRVATNYADQWTNLGTPIMTATTTTLYFPNSSTPTGTTFKEIQFRFDEARGDANTTAPSIAYALLEYRKIIPKRWGFTFVVDCSQPFSGKSPATLLANLQTAAELETLMTFQTESSVYYVQIVSVQGLKTTGATPAGHYQVVVTRV